MYIFYFLIYFLYSNIINLSIQLKNNKNLVLFSKVSISLASYKIFIPENNGARLFQHNKLTNFGQTLLFLLTKGSATLLQSTYKIYFKTYIILKILLRSGQSKVFYINIAYTLQIPFSLLLKKRCTLSLNDSLHKITL